MRRAVAILATCVALVVGLTAPARSANTKTTDAVIPPDARPQGRSYGEWSAQWWRWALQTPVQGNEHQLNPIVAGGGRTDCAYGQSGNVWFLAGTFYSSQLVRSCTVPAGITLMLSVINSWVDNASCPPKKPTTFTEEQLRAALKGSMDKATSMFATLDGRTVFANAGSDSAYRVRSPLFQYTSPKDNVLSTPYICGKPVPPGPVPKPGAVADGVFVMLEPLPKGDHVLHWGGSLPQDMAPTFTQDITYNIRVTEG